MERKQSFTSSFSHNFILKVTFILIVIKIEINFISLVLLSFGEGTNKNVNKLITLSQTNVCSVVYFSSLISKISSPVN